MNKLFFSIVYGCLMLAATMTVRAQEGNSNGQSVFKEIALNVNDNPEIRKLALEKVENNQNLFKQIALNEKDNPEIRKLAMSRLK